MAITLMQWLGSAAVVYGSTLFGNQRAARYRERPRELRRLATLLYSLQTEISYARVPLQEALQHVTMQADQHSMLATFFGDTAHLLCMPGMTGQTAWNKALTKYALHSPLTKEDLEIVTALGRTMGITGIDEQVGHVKASIEFLTARELEALEERKRYERVFKTVGLLTGTLIVVLLI